MLFERPANAMARSGTGASAGAGGRRVRCRELNLRSAAAAGARDASCRQRRELFGRVERAGVVSNDLAKLLGRLRGPPRAHEDVTRPRTRHAAPRGPSRLGGWEAAEQPQRLVVAAEIARLMRPDGGLGSWLLAHARLNGPHRNGTALSGTPDSRHESATDCSGRGALSCDGRPGLAECVAVLAPIEATVEPRTGPESRERFASAAASAAAPPRPRCSRSRERSNSALPPPAGLRGRGAGSSIRSRGALRPPAPLVGPARPLVDVTARLVAIDPSEVGIRVGGGTPAARCSVAARPAAARRPGRARGLSPPTTGASIATAPRITMSLPGTAGASEPCLRSAGVSRGAACRGATRRRSPWPALIWPGGRSAVFRFRRAAFPPRKSSDFPLPSEGP